jgi:stage II sporulation protein D
MLRRALLLITCLALAATSLAGARTGVPEQRSATAPPPSFFITGRGWGHGIGMSQWGAYGFAQRGTSYEAILAHYYRSTALGKAPVARIRVLLGEGKKALAVASDSPFSVRDGSGTVHQLQPGPYAFGPALKVKVDPAQPAKALPGPLVFLPGATPLKYGGKQYRGQFQVNTSKTLQLVNSLGLEPYLYGVVPREVPFYWPVEALKAQAVVARSYALATRKTGAFDLYPDTRSQVYLGIDHEKPATNAAVDATAGKVVLYEGQVAKTFFFSTSGGRTASAEDIWGEAVPYLVSVPDPYDSISPHHKWGPFPFTGAKLAKVFKMPGRVVDLQPELNPSRRIKTLTAVGTKNTISIAGAELRRRLGLRSTWFSVGVLSLSPPARTVVYGSRARLNGLARGLTQAVLQQRDGDGWRAVAAVKPDKTGLVSVVVKPTVTTQYRLTSGKVIAAPVRVPVAPLVRISLPRTPDQLRGYVRPAALAGARVLIQRQQGPGWATVAETAVDAEGSFLARLQLTTGVYRAWVASGRGFFAGTSPVLQVSTS